MECTKRKWWDRERSSGRWPGYVMSTKAIFNPAEVSFLWPKSVFRDVRKQSCLILRLLVTLRPPLHETLLFFQTSDRVWPTCGRLGRQTSARTKLSAGLNIAFVDMTYPKSWTGSFPLCPLIFSWMHIILQSLVLASKVSQFTSYDQLCRWTMGPLDSWSYFYTCLCSFGWGYSFCPDNSGLSSRREGKNDKKKANKKGCNWTTFIKK